MVFTRPGKVSGLLNASLLPFATSFGAYTAGIYCIRYAKSGGNEYFYLISLAIWAIMILRYIRKPLNWINRLSTCAILVVYCYQERSKVRSLIDMDGDTLLAYAMISSLVTGIISVIMEPILNRSYDVQYQRMINTHSDPGFVLLLSIPILVYGETNIILPVIGMKSAWLIVAHCIGNFIRTKTRVNKLNKYENSPLLVSNAPPINRSMSVNQPPQPVAVNPTPQQISVNPPPQQITVQPPETQPDTHAINSLFDEPQVGMPAQTVDMPIDHSPNPQFGMPAQDKVENVQISDVPADNKKKKRRQKQNVKKDVEIEEKPEVKVKDIPKHVVLTRESNLSEQPDKLRNTDKFPYLDLDCTFCKKDMANCQISPCGHVSRCESCLVDTLRADMLTCVNCHTRIEHVNVINKDRQTRLWIVTDRINISFE